jgi:putative peptidoglycan lipid II flippase
LLQKIESYKRGIIFSSGFNILSKLLLFLQSVAIAFYFGTQSKTDVFFYCTAVITLMAVFINTLDVSVLIPESMRIREQETEKESMMFLNFFIYLYLFIGLLTTFIICLSPINSFLLLSKFSKPILEQNISILLFALPLFLLMIVTTFLVNILASYKFFTIPMIIAMVNNTLALIFLILFHDYFNVLSILIGLVLAYLINIILLIYLMRKNLKWDFSFKMVSLEKRILHNMFYAQAGNMASALASYAPIYLLSGFNAGIITCLNFGQKVADIPRQLIIAQFVSVVGIKFNELYAKKDFEKLNEVYSKAIKILLFMLVPVSILFYLFSHEIIVLLFKRGTFNEASVLVSVNFFKYLGLLLPFFAIISVTGSLYYSAQIIKFAFGYQIFSNVLFITMLFFGLKYFDFMGYPFSLLVINILNVLIIQLFVRWLFPFINYIYILKYFALNILINLALGIFICYMRVYIHFNVPFEFMIWISIYMLCLALINLLIPINSDVNSFLRQLNTSLKSKIKGLSVKKTSNNAV